jgi:hypothetical protein
MAMRPASSRARASVAIRSASACPAVNRSASSCAACSAAMR